MSYEQISSIGFGSIGNNVLISDKASIYNPKMIFIGNNVRIDDFVVLSAGTGGIHIGNFIHIGVGSTLIGKEKITLCDFAGLSSRVSIYSSNDDYSGESLTNPTVPEKYRRVNHGAVYLGRHVIVGSGTVILPGVTLEDGVAVGALSLVNKTCEAFTIYAGVPVKPLRKRSCSLLEFEKILANDMH